MRHGSSVTGHPVPGALVTRQTNSVSLPGQLGDSSGNPATSQPVMGGLAPGQPFTGQPGLGQPVTGQPGLGQPVTGQSSFTGMPGESAGYLLGYSSFGSPMQPGAVPYSTGPQGFALGYPRSGHQFSGTSQAHSRLGGGTPATSPAMGFSGFSL